MQPSDLIPRPEWYPTRARGGWLSVRAGLWLGVTFTTCFVTGLISHFHQHPGWISLPDGPVWGYAVSQGIHVTTGIASIPLLAVKLWSVAPRFWERPLVGGLLRMLERGSVLVLVASAVFELVTGLLNVAQWYAFGFYFPPVHYAVAWLAIGSIVVHVGVQLPKVRALLSQPEGPVSAGDLNRRDVLRLGGLAALIAAGVTAGDKLPQLRNVGVLSQRSGAGPQGVPVNRTASAAGVVVDDDWQLMVVDRGIGRALRLADLRAMPQHSAVLPIACVEGWSTTQTWTGVRLRDLAELAGVDAPEGADVTSLEQSGAFNESALNAGQVTDGDALLALRVNDTDLSLDHGFPARIIVPAMPGVLNTKWVSAISFRSA